MFSNRSYFNGKPKRSTFTWVHVLHRTDIISFYDLKWLFYITSGATSYDPFVYLSTRCPVDYQLHTPRRIVRQFEFCTNCLQEASWDFTISRIEETCIFRMPFWYHTLWKNIADGNTDLNTRVNDTVLDVKFPNAFYRIDVEYWYPKTHL
jgi:hypothetical protein